VVEFVFVTARLSFPSCYKDSADPDDGTEQTVGINLGTDWQQYEFALSSFTTADLSDLYMVALFTFQGDEQVSIGVRRIQFAD
jgi:hypothetical protein